MNTMWNDEQAKKKKGEHEERYVRGLMEEGN